MDAPARMLEADGQTGALKAPDESRSIPELDMPLTPRQVTEALDGEIIASYAGASSASPVIYGPRDASTVLMAAGRRVTLRDGAYHVDGVRVTPEMLGQLAARLEPDVADRP